MCRPINSSNASGTQNKRLLIVYFGKAEVRVASTMTESSVCAISLPNATNQDFVCLLWGEGKAEVHVAPIWVPKNKLRLCLFAFGRAEVRVAFNDRAERYHSRNLVTERGVISLRNLLTERDSGFPREFQATLSHEQAPQVHVTASLIR